MYTLHSIRAIINEYFGHSRIPLHLKGRCIHTYIHTYTPIHTYIDRYIHAYIYTYNHCTYTCMSPYTYKYLFLS